MSSCTILLHFLFNQSETHLLLSSVVNDILERDLVFFFFIKVDKVWRDYRGDNKKIKQVLRKQCSANSFLEIGFVYVGLQKTLKGFVFCVKKNPKTKWKHPKEYAWKGTISGAICICCFTHPFCFHSLQCFVCLLWSQALSLESLLMKTAKVQESSKISYALKRTT